MRSLVAHTSHSRKSGAHCEHGAKKTHLSGNPPSHESTSATTDRHAYFSNLSPSESQTSSKNAIWHTARGDQPCERGLGGTSSGSGLLPEMPTSRPLKGISK